MDDREIIKKIAKIIGSENTEDDCAAIPFDENVIVASTYMLHETTDFPKGITDWQIGWMSAAVTLSDIASTGAKPLSVLLAAGLDLPGRIEEITKGANECCMRAGAKLAGGDVDSHNELTIVTTGIGIVSKENHITRKGAKQGEGVYVAGNLGHAQEGLINEHYFKDLCEPQPKTAEGIVLGHSHVSCMMDISDGLCISLYDLSEINGCGFDIEKKYIPLSEGISFETAFFGGGDFGLLYTCPEKLYKEKKLPGFKIGVVSKSSGVRADGKKISKRGYSHIWNV